MHNSNRHRAWVALALLAGLAMPFSASAKPEFLQEFLAEYPPVVGTRLESCNICHTNPPRRNPYGTDFNLAGRVFQNIESADSDGDGVNNLTEIQALTFPGDPLDYPGALPVATATPTNTVPPVPTLTPMPTLTPLPTNTPLATATIVPGPCHGDCNGNGAVAINELIIAVNIALGNATADQCTLADGDGDGEVRINELVRAVSRALNGCPPQ